MDHMDDIDRLFDKTKGQLFFHKGAGFLGNILSQVNFRWESSIDTACISVKELLWSPEFFLTRDAQTRVTILAHELWHNGLLHHIRRGNRCPDYWNQAADYVINLMLKKHGFYMDGFPFLLDDRFDNLSTEEVYDILVKEGGKPMENPLGKDIIESDDLTDADKAVAVGQVVAAVTAARVSNMAGDLPGELNQVIEEFLHPKLPWHTILFQFFNSLTSDEYSYARPNRRFDDPILPGKTSRNGLDHICYYLDISGSISDQEIVRFNSEVKFIQEELNPERLTLVTFDTEIHDVYEFERDDPFNKIEITGRGGTCLKQVFDHAQRMQPTAMIVFSDLCVNIPEDPGVPIIWVCVNNKNADPGYGKLIHITEGN